MQKWLETRKTQEGVAELLLSCVGASGGGESISAHAPLLACFCGWKVPAACFVRYLQTVQTGFESDQWNLGQ